jgi:hypothetical protein
MIFHHEQGVVTLAPHPGPTHIVSSESGMAEGGGGDWIEPTDS